MIKREVTDKLAHYASQYPVVAILGPRQSGKTTLSKSVFSSYEYISFEDLDKRQFALTDPREFLRYVENKNGVILDEIQHVPSLLSYIQTYVDSNKKKGYFILTGSQNFLVQQTVSQTLAGRMAIITLLPLSISELDTSKLLSDNSNQCIFNGGYPRVWSDKLEPNPFYLFYTRTYLEQDVRMITQVHDLNTFEKFLRLCAGRIGQLINYTALANECGVSHNTIKAWLSILEASYIIFFLQPHFKNFNKRLTKSSKLYFYDTGLACALLSIKSEEQLATHYFRGALFECLMISELYKQIYNRGSFPQLYFWQDQQGHEIDCIMEEGLKLVPIEIKSGSTIDTNFFSGLAYWNKLSETDPKDNYLIYGGLEDQTRSQAHVLGWKSAGSIITAISD